MYDGDTPFVIFYVDMTMFHYTQNRSFKRVSSMLLRSLMCNVKEIDWQIVTLSNPVVTQSNS